MPPGAAGGYRLACLGDDEGFPVERYLDQAGQVSLRFVVGSPPFSRTLASVRRRDRCLPYRRRDHRVAHPRFAGRNRVRSVTVRPVERDSMPRRAEAAERAQPTKRSLRIVIARSRFRAATCSPRWKRCCRTMARLRWLWTMRPASSLAPARSLCWHQFFLRCLKASRER